MAYSIELDFFTNQNKTYRMRINNANPLVTGAQVKSVMNTIVNKGNMIVTSAGCPIAIKAAAVVQHDTAEI